MIAAQLVTILERKQMRKYHCRNNLHEHLSIVLLLPIALLKTILSSCVNVLKKFLNGDIADKEPNEPVKKVMSEEEIYQYAKECEYLARKKDRE